MRARWLIGLVSLIAGGVLGAAAIVVTTEINRATATDSFCTSCHSMATVAVDPHFKQSAHRVNADGIKVSCSDCHIPPGNWFEETYTHVSMGIKDVIAEKTHNFDDPAVWEQRRSVLAEDVRALMQRDDSSACRKCHDATMVVPKTDGGRAAHAMMQQNHITCISCHSDVAHGQVARHAGVQNK